MAENDDRWATRFPRLFQESYVAYADCRIRCTTVPVPDALVTRLHLIAVTNRAEIVVCRKKTGDWFLPGGTREPGESLLDLVRRELMEETGAALRGEPQYVAAHVADSGRARPHRPHLPHPRAYWSYAAAHVEIVGAPTNPPDGEQVVEVAAVTPGVAAGIIEADALRLGDIIRLADAMGLVRPA